MAFYKKNPIIVEVFSFSDINKIRHESIIFSPYYFKFKETFFEYDNRSIFNKRFIIHSHEKSMIMKESDYLLYDEKETFNVLSKEKLDTYFQEVTI
jgi:hypothetical protein